MKSQMQGGRLGEQLALALAVRRKKRPWGGAREGAGRKKTGKRSDPLHRTRPIHRKQHPVHVVLRTRKDVPRLRRGKVYDAVHRAMRTLGPKHAFRVVHVSIQHNHVHFLVEADGKRALSLGMQALAISLAHWINAACGRSGKVFAHRYHATAITSPRQTRNALAYVLNNWRRHQEDRGHPRARVAAVDPYSSGIVFDGWSGAATFAIPERYDPLPVARPRTWLLATGWKRHPAIDCREVPRGSP